MNTGHRLIVHSAALSVLCMASAALAAPPKADKHKPVRPRTAEAQARRMTLVRVGWAKARPDAATIELPFSVEGDTFEQLDRRRTEVLRPVQDVVARFDKAPWTVSVVRSQSGQVVRDGKTIKTDMGTISVFVRNIADLKGILEGVAKTTAAAPIVHVRIGNAPALMQARRRAQLNAIATARRDADELAKAAGTKIVGVWEMNEGESKSADATDILVSQTGDVEVPAEILAATAQITIVFEMAPSRTP